MLWRISYHWISGMMLGGEYIAWYNNAGVSVIVIDLLILRLMFEWGDGLADDDEDEWEYFV